VCLGVRARETECVCVWEGVIEREKRETKRCRKVGENKDECENVCVCV